VRLSNTHFDTDLPYWQDYLPFLQCLVGRRFPGCDQLNSFLPEGLISDGGQSIRFVPSTELGNDAYESRIYTTGQVSTRPGNWHDVFNALVWARFPRIKTAMNALHFHAGTQAAKGARGALRDTLTLFDECGVIVFSNCMESLTTLAKRRWTRAFQTDAFSNDIQLAISGHAMLEKYLSPYKAMTAKAMLVHVSKGQFALPRGQQLDFLDKKIAENLRVANCLTQPACLSPLPLAGIPGWWPSDKQDSQFYNDPMVFRPPSVDMVPAPVVKL